MTSKYGWKIARIRRVSPYINNHGPGVAVELAGDDWIDKISFASPCFASAKEGETWAVKLEPAPPSILGLIQAAVKLEGEGVTLGWKEQTTKADSLATENRPSSP